ncbi:hypothetical protein pdam_00007087 [Pocillopora damicornis]|uniref:Transmembrane protein n=1 Tax=Pocillopora damicornis TaxID=46731 RepID=A0A3M6T8Z1_POCDA|nr:hypothetical protein pdam_00007087 [Pocillopora damicornis]
MDPTVNNYVTVPSAVNLFVAAVCWLVCSFFLLFGRTALIGGVKERECEVQSKTNFGFSIFIRSVRPSIPKLRVVKKKRNDPLGFIVLQTQLAFTIGSRNKQAILDSYQSEIFCYTMNPLMIKPREYKLS